MTFDEHIKKVLIEEWEKVRTDIIANYETKKMRASGQLPESMEVIYNNRSVSLMGNQYAEQLEYGRKPSSKLPPLQGLYFWILDKGIMSRTEKEYKIRGLAYAIAKKIQKEGYNRAGYGGVGLISEILTDERIKNVIDLVGKQLFPIFEAEILTFFKQKSND